MGHLDVALNDVAGIEEADGLDVFVDRLLIALLGV